jgi:hypothetical protein
MPHVTDYRDRLARLVATKLRQTAEKHERFGYWDEDDLSYVPPPADWKWEPTPNHSNGSFYGLDGWSDNFASIMAAHPTYIDPDDALAGRWMAFLNRSRKVGWKPEFPYPHLAGEIAMYAIEPGIGGESLSSSPRPRVSASSWVAAEGRAVPARFRAVQFGSASGPLAPSVGPRLQCISTTSAV